MDAPEPLRAAARGIALGYAPLPGAARLFLRADLQRRLHHHPQVRAALQFPERVAVRRATRLPSREEACAAIRAALEKNGHCAGASCARLVPRRCACPPST